jgi:predicted cupin superfamily sugar epimerase
MNTRARNLIETLGLIPHPERGFYAETYRATAPVFSASHGGERSASTAIYFLVTDDEPTTSLHRLKSDEVFHLYEGGPLEILQLRADGSVVISRLGLDIIAGERPQVVVPSGTWFGTLLVAGASHCLVGLHCRAGIRLRGFRTGRRPGTGFQVPSRRRQDPSHATGLRARAHDRRAARRQRIGDVERKERAAENGSH